MNSAADKSIGSDDYKLIVEGNSYGRLHGSLFFHEQQLKLAKKNVKILLQTERDVYAEGQDGKIYIFCIITRIKISIILET